MSKFKPGDVVQLNSGGPPMTVESLDKDFVKCVWFAVDGDNYGEPMQAMFPEAILRLSGEEGAA